MAFFNERMEKSAMFLIGIGGLIWLGCIAENAAKHDPVEETIKRLHACSVMNKSLSEAVTESQQQDFLSEIQKSEVKKPVQPAAK